MAWTVVRLGLRLSPTRFSQGLGQASINVSRIHAEILTLFLIRPVWALGT